MFIIMPKRKIIKKQLKRALVHQLQLIVRKMKLSPQLHMMILKMLMLQTILICLILMIILIITKILSLIKLINIMVIYFWHFKIFYIKNRFWYIKLWNVKRKFPWLAWTIKKRFNCQWFRYFIEKQTDIKIMNRKHIKYPVNNN